MGFLQDGLRQAFLVLEGPTRTGKSQWVRLFAHTERGTVYEVDCSGDIERPDLRDLKFGKHTH
eukprot:12906868-Prorocentrum_lima.AAC.1